MDSLHRFAFRRPFSKTQRKVSARQSRLHGRVDRNKNALPPIAVAPGRAFTGAWIETVPSRHNPHCGTVAPSRARGSKLATIAAIGRRASRAFTGAWIETSPTRYCRASSWVAPSRARGSKREIRRRQGEASLSRLHGRVDRNRERAKAVTALASRAFTGARIETATGSAAC